MSPSEAAAALPDEEEQHRAGFRVDDDDHEAIPTGAPPVVARIEKGEKMPVTVIMVGMAGSGKTSLMAQLQTSLEESKQQQSAYCVNLDPATLNVPYDVSIDIRDTVNYKQVMKTHKLGPNGAIMTSLNLFATKFDQVMKILEARAYSTTTTTTVDNQGHNNSKPKATEVTIESGTQKEQDKEEEDSDDDDNDVDDEPMDYILVDTPGQIEAFTWSASGSIMSESLASAFPTVLCFVVDTARCASSPNTFMSNMLYACSMLYRTRLPLVVCFNKIDVVSHEFCLEWMRDYEKFQQALDDMSDSAGFYGSLTRSLSLVLDEFYSNFANACGVSAVTGEGIMDDFWTTVQKAATQDFALDYIEDLKNRMEEQQARREAIARCSARRLQRDLESSNKPPGEE